LVCCCTCWFSKVPFFKVDKLVTEILNGNTGWLWFTLWRWCIQIFFELWLLSQISFGDPWSCPNHHLFNVRRSIVASWNNSRRVTLHILTLILFLIFIWSYPEMSTSDLPQFIYIFAIQNPIPNHKRFENKNNSNYSCV
jgi:hypothetical protein